MKTFEHDGAIIFNQWVTTDRNQLTEQEREFDDLIEKFLKLTEHHYITKQQNEFYKETKANWKFGECIRKFSENYSFLDQDAAQSFHWNISQATIHPFIIYYGNLASDILHKSYVCTSDHKTHDTVTAHSFLKHFYKHNIRSAPQYKNFKIW